MTKQMVSQVRSLGEREVWLVESDGCVELTPSEKVKVASVGLMRGELRVPDLRLYDEDAFSFGLDEGMPGSKMHGMVEQARVVEGSDEAKMKALFGIIWGNIEYASKDAVDALPAEQCDWFKKHVYNPDTGGSGQNGINLSDVVELGLGECNTLAAAFMVCARAAGYQVILANGNVNNTKTEGLDLRGDRDKLFMFYPPHSIAPHAWTYVHMEGDWTPVDPITGLMGCRSQPEHTRVFRQNYWEHVGLPVQNWASELPEGLELSCRPDGFQVGSDLSYDVFLGIGSNIRITAPDQDLLDSFSGRVSFRLDDQSNPSYQQDYGGHLHLEKIEPAKGFRARKLSP